MYRQGKCYKCGGFLAVNDAEDASVCPFCNHPFVVEKAIQCFMEAAPQTEEAPQKPEITDSDFVTENGVLLHYNGYTKKTVRIPDGITAIGDTAFQGMNNIETVHIPTGVRLIGAGAFSGCKMLHTVRIPEGVEIIDRDVFNGCTSLKNIRFPSSTKSLGAGALAGCTALESVFVPRRIELLPWRIFEGCTSLTAVVIPKKVNTIEDMAFAECTSLADIRFDCMHPEDDPAVGVKRIGMNAFRNCTSLEHIDLPETVEYIGNQAFRGCSGLKTLHIPKSVRAIYPLAFADCTALAAVSFAGDTKLYKGSNPYKHGDNVATFLNCPKLLSVTYDDLQPHYWAFPAYMKALEPVNIENGRCRYCGGTFRGLSGKVCTVCHRPKDYD